MGLWFRRRFLKDFYHRITYRRCGHLCYVTQIPGSIPQRREALHQIWLCSDMRFQRRKYLKITFIYIFFFVYSPGTGTDTPWVICFIVNINFRPLWSFVFSYFPFRDILSIFPMARERGGLVLEPRTPERDRVVSLSKDIFTHRKVLAISRKRWLRPDMAKKMFTETILKEKK